VGSNAVELSGRLIEIEPLRHTPAGMPLLHFTIAHVSSQLEAGHERRVECEVKGVALGEPAKTMAHLKAGDEIRVHGFLNRKNRMSAQLVLHATRTELLKDRDHA
jgi:primosomal replication protein N